MGTLLSQLRLCVIFISIGLFSYAQNPVALDYKGELNEDHSTLDSLLKRCTEIISKRTINSRTYKAADGTQVIEQSSQPLTYKSKSGQLLPIDLQLKQTKNNSWASACQAHPCYYNSDQSTTITLNKELRLTYNKNVLLNERTVGNAPATIGASLVTEKLSDGIIKTISFRNNTIETDYILQSANRDADYIISEEIEFPENYKLSPDVRRGKIKKGKWSGDLILFSETGIEEARFHAPFCYDARGKWCIGCYELVNQNGRRMLKTIVPQAWLEKATFPVTIDPTVTGPTTTWLGGSMVSCLAPKFEKDSILIVVPPFITISNFFVSTSYQASIYTSTPKKAGRFSLQTSCNTTAWQSCDTSILPGTCYMIKADLLVLTCCIKPSCDTTKFYLTQNLQRISGGLACDTEYVYYDPTTAIPFSAYVVGKTVEATWTLTPATICSDKCILNATVQVKNGVPPYTVTHPWSTDMDTVGKHGFCISTGKALLQLTIPNCPTICGVQKNLSVPPPLVVDFCGDTVQGIPTISVTVNPKPKIIATPDSVSVCTGTPINFKLTSCVSGTTINWKGDDNTSGTGDITDPLLDTTASPIKVKYTITSSAVGCVGDTVVLPATVIPQPLPGISKGDTILLGNSTSLLASGGTTYSWTPSTGLSCTACPNPVASPSVTTTYSVKISTGPTCFANDTVTIHVIAPIISFPNVFSPNNDGVNDTYVITNKGYKKISCTIYNRWGLLLAEWDALAKAWDGKTSSGNEVPEGTYFYIANAVKNNGDASEYKGFIELLRK